MTTAAPARASIIHRLDRNNYPAVCFSSRDQTNQRYTIHNPNPLLASISFSPIALNGCLSGFTSLAKKNILVPLEAGEALIFGKDIQQTRDAQSRSDPDDRHFSKWLGIDMNDVAHFTSVSFLNYKALRHFSISLQNFNILVGPNNSVPVEIADLLNELDRFSRTPV